MFDELARLTSLDAPVGFEEPVLEYMATELDKCCEYVDLDARGNLYGWLPGDPQALTILIMAHADEVGCMVTRIMPQGFLRLTRLGYPTEMVLPGQRVRVLSTQGPLDGVIGVKPGHILSGDAARQVPVSEALYIDVGATSAEEAQAWGIEPGTPVVFYGPLTRTAHPHRVFGKAVDNRIGCLCVLEIARRLQSIEFSSEIVFGVTVEEEVGLRGAEVAAAHVAPDVVIAIDTVPAGGTPEVSPDELPWEIGLGPLLKVRETRGLSTHGPLRKLLRQVAAEAGIPYQLIVDTAGITDGTSAQQAGPQIAAAVLGLPRRYSHSAAELLDLRDAEHLIQWVCAAVPQLTDRQQMLRLQLPKD